MKKQTTKALVVTLALVSSLALSQFSQAQTFKKVSVQGGAKIAQIASGGTSVWALGTNGHPYRYSGSSFVQVNTNSYAQIAVGGGNVRQSDTVWALDAAGNIYHVVKSGTTYVFNHIPGNLDTIAVGIGYQDNCHPYEVWGLNTSSEIWRFNFCAHNWDQEPGFLCAIQVGGGDIYGTDCNGALFYFDFPSLSFQPTNLINVGQVATAPQGAWVTQYDPGDDTTGIRQIIWPQSSVEGPIWATAQWVEVSGIVTIRAGGDGVWVINSSGQVSVLRYVQISLRQIPGIVLASMSVGSGGGVWGIDSSGQVCAFSTP